jgi:hypothetical protein
MHGFVTQPVMFRLTILASALLLAGCTRTIETRIHNAGQSDVEKLGFVLAPAEKTASSELIRGRELVVAQMVAKGFTASQSGPYYLEVGVSARPAFIALRDTDKIWAAASTKRKSRQCMMQEYRVAVALTRISDGAVMYQGSSGEYHCKAILLANTLVPLVDHAMADLGNPRGDYIIKAKVE